MKAKIKSNILLILFIIGYCFAQSTSLSSVPSAQKKTNIAVINLKKAAGVTLEEIDLITDRLRGELFNTGKVNVMEREQMQEILKEQGFQQSGACTNEECMVEMGQLLGVEQLVTGSLGKVGSMFLVNLRIIDVKTGKITKALSVDIKGEIEDVVAKLPSISAQLVGLQPVEQQQEKQVAQVAIEKKEDPKKIEQTQAEEEIIEEKPEKQKEVKEEINEKALKNKNRFGIRLGTNIFGSKVKRIYNYTKYDTSYYYSDVVLWDTTVDYDELSAKDTITRSPAVNYFVKGIIKAGPFMTIEIGGGFSYQSTEYKSYNLKEVHDLYIYSLPDIGVNFVKRWYPLKLNIGIFGDFNILYYTQDYYSRLSEFEPFKKDTTFSYIGFNGGVGARAGAEIMAGKHVGFNVDFVFYNSEFTTLEKRFERYDSMGNLTLKIDESWVLTMPKIAVGLGVNFYF
jgi:curli biogenesis system outer membrane secretion channel CsgG